jgi:hypothetical protein
LQAQATFWQVLGSWAFPFLPYNQGEGALANQTARRPGVL